LREKIVDWYKRMEMIGSGGKEGMKEGGREGESRIFLSIV